MLPDIRFDSRSEFVFTDGSYWKNVIVFRDNMGPSVHVYNNEKNILILGERPTQQWDGTTLAAEAKWAIKLTKSGKRFALS